MDMLASVSAINDLVNKVENFRNENEGETTFHTFYETTVAMCSRNDINIAVPTDSNQQVPQCYKTVNFASIQLELCVLVVYGLLVRMVYSAKF